jgi:hypothetical protein
LSKPVRRAARGSASDKNTGAQLAQQFFDIEQPITKDCVGEGEVDDESTDEAEQNLAKEMQTIRRVVRKN